MTPEEVIPYPIHRPCRDCGARVGEPCIDTSTGFRRDARSPHPSRTTDPEGA